MSSVDNLHPVVRGVLGCGSFLVAVCCALAIAAIVLPSAEDDGPPEGKTTATWDRIAEQIQQNEQEWQAAALEELRQTIPFYAGGATPTFEECTVLARTEDGKHLVAEAIWYDASVPPNMAPRISSLGLIRDRGMNQPEVVQLAANSVSHTHLRFRIQEMIRLVPDSEWSFGTE